MPTPIQRPEQALALAKAYNIKGKLPLMLDEVVVPVHIVGELDPSAWTPGTGGSTPPAGSKIFTGRFGAPTWAAPGAGRHQAIVVEMAPSFGITSPYVIDWIQWDNSSGLGNNWVCGVGFVSSPLTVDVGADQLMFKVNLAAELTGPPTETLVGARFTALDAFLPHANDMLEAKLIDGGEGMRRMYLGWVMGSRRSLTAGGATWRTANGAAMVRGNHEFWIMNKTGNQEFGVTIHATVLPVS